MKSKIKRPAVLITAALFAALFGCGGNNNGAVTPAPAAGAGSVPMPGGGYAVGNCGAPAGGIYPLNPQGAPSIGTLTTYNGSPPGFTPGGRANSITLTAFTTSQLAAGIQNYNVVANGTLTFPDMVSALPYLAAQGYGLCISSSNMNGIGGTPGHYVVADNSLAITLIGMVPAPYGYSPQTLPGGVGGQPYVQVEIGYTCGAYMEVGGRITGCVDITVHQYNPYQQGYYDVPFSYYAQ